MAAEAEFFAIPTSKIEGVDSHVMWSCGVFGSTNKVLKHHTAAYPEARKLFLQSQTGKIPVSQSRKKAKAKKQPVE